MRYNRTSPQIIMFPKLIVVACLLVVAHTEQRARLALRLPTLKNIFIGQRNRNIDGRRIGSRIVGGNESEKGEFPHQVSLQWGLPPILPLSHLCGGSILNERWILTAGHCPRGVPFGSITVKAGKHRIDSREQGEQSSVVEKSFVHPQYPGNVAPYDIALLKLKTRLKLNKLVKAIALPKADSLPEGEAMLSGWGSTSSSQIPAMPEALQKAKLPLVGLETCRSAIEALAGPSPLAESNVCTGPLTGGVSACSGDSGGPLIQVNNGTPEVVGIVSWGIVPCGTKGAPSVYTRVSAYNDWIVSTIAQNS